MKRTILLLMFALVATVYSQAQQIAVVSPQGATSLYQTLGEAIEGAAPSSVIYLPGGGFPIADSVKITKKLTIIGIGHKIKTENADGNTTITGNLFFNEGSDGSAVMGVYMTGKITIGGDGKEVDNVLVRYCNIQEFCVSNSKCLGTVVNQNYIRGQSLFSSASGEFTNNITAYVRNLNNGKIANNITTSSIQANYKHAGISECSNCSIKNNVIISQNITGSNNSTDGNMGKEGCALGDYAISINCGWTDVFVNPDGVKPTSDYHFKGEYEHYNSECGIYAGTGFSDSALPPIPYIVSKQIPEQTDAEGKLNIKIRVRAGE